MCRRSSARSNRSSARLGGLERQLKAELDRLVPEYQTARQGAARFFDAQDALEAGQNFVSAKGQNSEYAAALRQFSPQEREVFARGFAAELADRITELRDPQNVITQSFLSSPASVQRIRMALGPKRASQLEALLRVEAAVDQLRTHLGGSATARKVVETLGVSASLLTLGHAQSTGEWDKTHIIGAILGAGVAGLKFRSGQLDARVAARIGQMLASEDPAVLQRGLQMVTKSRPMMEALRAGTNKLEASIAGKTVPQVAGAPVARMLPSPKAAASEPDQEP